MLQNSNVNHYARKSTQVGSGFVKEQEHKIRLDRIYNIISASVH